MSAPSIAAVEARIRSDLTMAQIIAEAASSTPAVVEGWAA